MELLFKQRFFSWFDSYDIFNETGETVLEGKLSWVHMLSIMSVVLVKFSLFTYFLISSFGIFIVEKPP